MTRPLYAAAAAGLFLVAAATPAHATITNIWGPPGEICIVSAPCSGSFHYPIRQGRSIILDIEGQFVDLASGLEVVGSGITATTDHTTSSNRFIRVTVASDAAPGLHRILLHYAVELNGPDSFQILVLRAGKVTGFTPPDPTNYFNDVNVTLTGTSLDNAGVILLPEKIGTYSVGGIQFPQTYTLTQSIGTAAMSSSSAGQDVVAFHFDGGPFAEAKATVLLFDKQISADTCQQHRFFCYAGTDSTTTGETTVNIKGPNAVSSITFPFGSTVTLGSPVTAQIKLVRPAKSGGEVVRFELVPASSFVEASGSGTVFSPVKINSVTIPAGDQTKDVTVQLATVPEGCRLSCLAQFRTRMANFTIDQLPYLRIASFTVANQK